MRCMAGTTRGTRCRREGAQDGDMRRYCVQHGRQMRRIENIAELDLLFAEYGLTESANLNPGTMSWFTPSGKHAVQLRDSALEKGWDEVKRLAEFELRALNKVKVKHARS